MDLLILGGTIFLGKHIVREAISRGHTITVLHRGKHPIEPEMRERGVEEILCDRNETIVFPEGRKWDAVIDTSGYLPEAVEASCKALQKKVGRYLFISTISVYGDLSQPGITENAQLAALADPNERQITGETYGALKVLCEQVVMRSFGDSATTVRPGLIVGPDDSSGRFTYWPRRIREGGSVIVPGDGTTPVQFIDVRDLAAFVLDLLEGDRAGIVHATGPAHPLDMRSFVTTCREATQSDASFVYVSESFLEKELGESVQIPVWVPDAYANLNRMDISRALSFGLRLRPLEETIRDTMSWFDREPNAKPTIASHFLTRSREEELLELLEAKA